MVEVFNFIVGFFNVWRRRVGLVVLIFALGICCLSCEFLHVGYAMVNNQRVDLFLNSHNGFMWKSICPTPESYSFIDLQLSAGLHFSNSPIVNQFDCTHIQSHWQLCGIHVANGMNKSSSDPESILVVPGWPIVLLLTVVSAFLLIAKPRVSGSKDGSDGSEFVRQALTPIPVSENVVA